MARARVRARRASQSASLFVDIVFHACTAAPAADPGGTRPAHALASNFETLSAGAGSLARTSPAYADDADADDDDFSALVGVGGCLRALEPGRPGSGWILANIGAYNERDYVGDGDEIGSVPPIGRVCSCCECSEIGLGVWRPVESLSVHWSCSHRVIRSWRRAGGLT